MMSSGSSITEVIRLGSVSLLASEVAAIIKSGLFLLAVFSSRDWGGFFRQLAHIELDEDLPLISY